MDTRKLKGNTQRDDEVVTFAWEEHERERGWYERTRFAFPADMDAVEVMRRWNHFPALVEALEEALSDLQSPDMGGLTGAEHDGGAAEGTIHKIREVLKAASE